MSYLLPIIQSRELERKKLNADLADIDTRLDTAEAAASFYGTPLPTQPQPSGRIAVLSTTGVAYVSTGAAWVAVTATAVWG